jgi:hypothetical protein
MPEMPRNHVDAPQVGAPDVDAPDAAEPAPVARPLSAAARAALAEAEARRAAAVATTPAKELGGRDGPEPVRYGDWEVKGIASDF